MVCTISTLGATWQWLYLDPVSYAGSLAMHNLNLPHCTEPVLGTDPKPE